MWQLAKAMWTMSIMLIMIFLSACDSGQTYHQPAAPYCQQKKLEHQYIVHWKNSQNTLLFEKNIQQWLKQNQNEVRFVESNFSLPTSSRQFSRSPRNSIALEDRDLTLNSIHDQIGTKYSWELGFRGQGIVVAVIDSGVSLDFAQTSSKIKINDLEFQNGENQIDDDGNGYTDDIYGWNFITGTAKLKDELGHGTAIAGIITQISDSQVSLGIAPQAKIIPIEFIDQNGGTEFSAKEAIQYAISRKANVINNSWSINCSELLRDAFLAWSNEDVIFVNASGNEAIDVVANGIIPSSLDLENGINVGSSDLFGGRSSFSGYGSTVRIFAPGEFIPVVSPSLTLHDNLTSSGTSVSTAIISASAALIWSAFPTLKAKEIIELIHRGASKNSSDTNLVNIKNSLILGTSYHP